MISRFEGQEGRRRLIAALATQEAIAGDVTAAEAIAAVAELHQHGAGSAIIQERGEDNDIFFILAGGVGVHVSGREVARRTSGQHVGEMALIDPAAPRSASVVATDICVVAKVSEADFVRVAATFPNVWRNLARQLCMRLRQRNTVVRPVNARAKVFVGSSTEALTIAREIQLGLKHDPIDVTVWTDDVFMASHFVIEDLERQVSDADFAVLLVSPDDEVASRGQSYVAPRDNVIFELGLFVGALGHRRTFIVKPKGLRIKLPSDLLGLTALDYDMQNPNVSASVATVCTELRKVMHSVGVR